MLFSYNAGSRVLGWIDARMAVHRNSDGIPDPRPLYFRLALESASNSIILVLPPPLILAQHSTFPMDPLVYTRTKVKRRTGEADRWIATFHDQGPKISAYVPRKHRDMGCNRGSYDFPMIYRSFNWTYRPVRVSREPLHEKFNIRWKVYE